MLRLAVPPGIGDVYWSLLKLRALRAHHPGEHIHLVVKENPIPRVEPLLTLVPGIDSFSTEPYSGTQFVSPTGEVKVLVHDVGKIPEGWRAEQIPAGRNINGFDYFFWANRHLEEGNRIETWFPEFEVAWDMPLNIPERDVHNALDYLTSIEADRYFCIYTSAMWGNLHGFNEGRWCAHHWMELVRRVWDAFHIPTILVGAPYDLDYAQHLDRWCHPGLFNTVGQFSLGETLTILRLAGAFVGFASGLTILSTHMGIPTVMLWPDSDRPTRYGVWHRRGMQTGWVNPAALPKGKYVPVEFRHATPDLLWKSIATWIMEGAHDRLSAV